jgi:hypothetical protein
VRVSVLEERLQTFDEISRQMLNKLEQAVDKISESNRNISQILIRHEERIDRSAEANGTMLQLIHKTENELKAEMINQQKQVEDLKRTRWIWAGIVIASSFFLGQSGTLSKIFHQLPIETVPYERRAD